MRTSEGSCSIELSRFIKWNSGKENSLLCDQELGFIHVKHNMCCYGIFFVAFFPYAFISYKIPDANK